MLDDALYKLIENYLRDGPKIMESLNKIASTEDVILEVDFEELIKFIKLGIIYNSARFISLFKHAVRTIIKEYNPEKNLEHIYIVFKNISKIFNRRPNQITETDVGKFRCIEGTIVQVYQPIMKLHRAFYRCKKCGSEMGYSVDINEDTINKSYCSFCNTKNVLEFIPSRSDYIAIQFMNLQDTEQATQHVVPVLVTGPYINKIDGGQRVRVQGIVQVKRPSSSNNGMKTYTKIYIEALSIERLGQSFDEIVLAKEDEEKIIELSKRKDILELLTRSIAPSIYGYEDIKLSILLQQVGGVKKIKPDRTVIRGRIHILLCGEPGVAKSQLLRWVATNLLKTKYSTGKGSSGVGLTASVNKETGPDGSGHWVLSIGALPLADGGTLCIDEFDKMRDEDRDHMQTAMEQGIIAIDKADIHTELKAECNVLAAANPKYRRYNPEIPLAENLNLPTDLLTRFDIIFHVRDYVREEKDRKLAQHILEVHSESNKLYDDIIDVETLVKYISYARKIKPRLTASTKKYIEDIYIGLRGTSEEGNTKITFTARQLEALIRLSEACAKLHLRKHVKHEDVDIALRVIKGYIASVMDTKPGEEMDIDRIMSDISYRDRSIIQKISYYLRKECMAEDKLYDILKAEGYSEEEINHAMKQMHFNNDIIYTQDGKVALRG